MQLTKEGAIDYIRFLSKEAKSHGLAIGLKNAAELIDDVLTEVDFSINEECALNDECYKFEKFIDAGKPVFHIEYNNEGPHGIWDANLSSSICYPNFSTIIKSPRLNSWSQYCTTRN